MQISIYFTDLGTVEGTVIGPTGMPATGITVVAYKDVTPPRFSMHSGYQS
jgi:hypothetical protein